MMPGGGMEMFAALMMMGVRVREVVDLEECSVWLADLRLFLIDRNLSASDRAALADEMLTEAALSSQALP